MSLSTILIIAGLLGAALGVKKPWIGGLPGFLIGPLLFYISFSSNIVPLKGKEYSSRNTNLLLRL